MKFQFRIQKSSLDSNGKAYSAAAIAVLTVSAAVLVAPQTVYADRPKQLFGFDANTSHPPLPKVRQANAPGAANVPGSPTETFGGAYYKGVPVKERAPLHAVPSPTASTSNSNAHQSTSANTNTNANSNANASTQQQHQATKNEASSNFLTGHELESRTPKHR